MLTHLLDLPQLFLLLTSVWILSFLFTEIKQIVKSTSDFIGRSKYKTYFFYTSLNKIHLLEKLNCIRYCKNMHAFLTLLFFQLAIFHFKPF